MKRKVLARERTANDVLKQFRLVYGAVHRHFREVQKRCGLSGAQAWLLNELARSPADGVSNLAAHLSLHQSTVSQLVDKLVRSGHVERIAHEEDGRRVRLRLTRRGAALARRLPQPAEGVLPRALDELPEASLHALRLHLTRLISHLHKRHSLDASAHLGEL
jgi:DNA-binding MarR family transcriptional regulator